MPTWEFFPLGFSRRRTDPHIAGFRTQILILLLRETLLSHPPFLLQLLLLYRCDAAPRLSITDSNNVPRSAGSRAGWHARRGPAADRESLRGAWKTGFRWATPPHCDVTGWLPHVDVTWCRAFCPRAVTLCSVLAVLLLLLLVMAVCVYKPITRRWKSGREENQNQVPGSRVPWRQGRRSTPFPWAGRAASSAGCTTLIHPPPGGRWPWMEAVY